MTPSLSIMPEPKVSMLPAGNPAPTMPVQPPKMREFGDAMAMRKAIYDNAIDAARNIEPLSDDRHTMRLTEVDWHDPERFTRKERKNAILTGGTLARRMRGTWELVDNATGGVLERRKQVIGRVPYLSSMGTFTHRGNEYTVNHQQRLNPGVFARVKDNGELESHFNILPGKGVSHRYFLDPAKGVFKMKFQQAEMPLMPLLQTLGATDKEVRDAWGNELYAANYKENDASVIKKLAAKLLRGKEHQGIDEGTTRQRLVQVFNKMELDGEVTKRTLGHPYTNVTKEVILAATKKLLQVNRKEVDPDDRDHLAYQTLYGPEDLFAERLRRDHGNVRRDLFKKVSLAGNLSRMPAGALTKQIEQVLLGSGLAQALEEINPAEVFDKQSRVTRMGEGGIPSLESIPDEARSVQASHLGFVDLLRTPESFRVGVDLNMSRGARKGSDGRLYTQLQDRKGAMVWKSPQDLTDASLATPDAMKWNTKRVPVIKHGKLAYVPKDEVDYVLPNFEDAFSPLGNMVPLKSMVKGQRVAMASRMLTQALSLRGAEAPLVQSGMPGSKGARSFEEEYGKHMGAVRADSEGRVEDIRDGVIKVRYADGRRDEIELYDNHPFNRKSYLHQTPLIKPGDVFKKDQMLAKSNYTDDTGTTALGANFNVAYMPWEGYNYEDAQVISESAAKRMTSEHMYQHDLEVTDRHKVGKKAFISLFPAKFDKKTLESLDEHGVIRPGATVEYGQPLILAAQERDRAQNKIHKKKQAGYNDESVVWKHHDPGFVTDVAWSKNGPVVVVKSESQMQVGDKLSGRYGDKGVVAAIIPDDQMPHDKNGKPYEILLNPLGIISRTNPAQMVEAMLGKLAVLKGHPIKVPDFEDEEDMTAWTQRQLRQHNLSDLEDVYHSKYGKISGVATGNRFFMKLHHTAESKGQGRGSGGYSADETPSKGGETGSKRISMMDTNAILSHGAMETLNDVGSIKGQRNDNWWLQFMQGYTPADPKVPLVYEKFVNQLKGAGVNVVREGHQTHVMALTNKDIDVLAGTRRIKSGDTVRFDKDLKPVEGGLFDPLLTGGHGGKRWSAIDLPEPLPNPVMEEPIRTVLGLTQKDFLAVIGGDRKYAGFGTGPEAIGKALENLNVDREIDTAKANYYSGRGTLRDAALRKWKFLKKAKDSGLHPKDWVLNSVPVLPPAFRPVSVMGNSGIPLVSDPNYLYKELIDARNNLTDMKKHVGEDGVGPERQALYHAFKAVTGLADPVHPKLQEKGVKGILKSVFGSSPKFGTVQRKLLSSTVDNVGRAVITPNPDFDMDTVGVPENQAFDVYTKFIVRRLKRRGMPIREALRHVKEKTELARTILTEEMEDRPVYINRAPVLHKFGIMAFRPKLVKGDVLQVSPLIVKGFNADFDGDAMQFHVPTTDASVKEAYERMLPSRSLLSPSDFKTPMAMPGQEYLGGLHYGTRKREDNGKKQRPRIFRTKQEAIQAYKRGDIRADASVHIMED